MQQAPLIDSFAFDPFSCLQDGLAASEVDVGRGEIAEALVVSPVIVVIDEGAVLGFESIGAEPGHTVRLVFFRQAQNRLRTALRKSPSQTHTASFAFLHYHSTVRA